MDRIDPEKEGQLVKWFKRTFQERTPAKTILDVVPTYRVTSHEIAEEARQLGIPVNGLLFMAWWIEVFERNQLRQWCNNLLEQAGESSL